MDQSSISEAEAYADDLTREILNDTNNLTSDHEDLARHIGDDDEELVRPSADEALVRLTDNDDSQAKDDEPMPAASAAVAFLEEKPLKVTIDPVVRQYSDDSLEESQSEQGQQKSEPEKETEMVIVNESEKKDDMKENEEEHNLDLEPKTAAAESEEQEVEAKQQKQKKQDKQDQREDEEDRENFRVAFVGEGTKEPEIEQTDVADEKQQREVTVEEEIAQRQQTGQEQEQEEEQEHQRPADDIWTTLHDITNSEPLHQTFKTAVNTSNISHDVEQEVEEEHGADKMEFTKNYSDDLLMGAGEQVRATGTDSAGGHDLADFELPPYTGSSSSGSEQAASTKQQSPAKQRKSSNQQAPQQASSSAVSSGLAPSDLTAVKNILISSYSKVAPITHWKKPIESGIIFAIGLTLISALTFFSIISVVAYSALGIVLASGLIRIYKTSMKALNRSAETPVDHIWEKVLSLDVSMSPERLHELIDSSQANLNASFVYFKQVLLVEDKVAAIKFFLFLYSLTYIGAWFNGLTLITIFYVSMFSAPIVYEKNKTKIDEYLNLATSQVSCAVSMVTGKVSALVFGSQSGGNAKKQK